MAKYEITGSVLKVDLEDGKDVLSVDVKALAQPVQDAGLMFGIRTALRNTTAGKMEDLVKARAAMEARLALFTAGKWESDEVAKASIELSDAERTQIIGDVIVLAKKAKGDTRSPGDILRAFNALSDAQRQAAVVSLQKMIDKKLKDALKQKRTMAKSAENTAMAF